MSRSAELPPLGPGAEFDAIRDFLAEPGGDLPGEVVVGPGDDAVVLSDRGAEGGSLLLTVDRMTEGVHFRREWASPEDVAWRAMAASLSDVAAMGGRPVGALVSLGLPGAGPEGELRAGLRRGLAEASRAFGAPLLGGDLTHSPHGLVVDVTAVGRAHRPVTRTGGRPGDELWVTGRLGGSGAAVAAWEEGRRPPQGAMRRFNRPEPRLAQGVWLAERDAPVALIDLSDGLAGDAGHLAAAGGVAVVVEESALPVDPVAVEVAGSPEAAAALALRGGEDFELAFLARPHRVEELVEPFRQRFHLELSRVGEVVDGEGAWLRPASGGEVVAMEGLGYDHMREDHPREEGRV